MRAGLADAAPRTGWHERYRERCRDENGVVHDVIVSKDAIGLTRYRLADGRSLRFVDDCEFELIETGMMLSRCE